ncbi:MAG: DUF2325 domain-containing protein [Lachnospiraceae bacterium]|nr:DUF2325 domain-containing protein [Lachnospiraceae bacterium]
MSVVIVGGNECMEGKYKEICNGHGCDAKVFCKLKGSLQGRIGSPDLMILFTNTVSHKMMRCAMQNIADKTQVVYSHSSSGSSLKQILQQYAD